MFEKLMKKFIKKIHEQECLGRFAVMKKACEPGFPYCFLTDYTKFFLWASMLLDFGSLTQEAS